MKPNQNNVLCSILLFVTAGLTSCRPPTNTELFTPQVLHVLKALKAVDSGDQQGFKALLSDRSRTKMGKPSTRDEYSNSPNFRGLRNFFSEYEYNDWRLDLKQDSAMEFPNLDYEVAYYYHLRPDAEEEAILGITVLQKTPHGGGKTTYEIVDLYRLD